MGETAPKRVQLRRTKGWRMPENTVKVDRNTNYGSPFPITKGRSTGADGAKDIWSVGTWEGPAMWFCDSPEEAAERSVAAFRAWITSAQQAGLLRRGRLALRGKNVGCWCGLDAPCHGDVWLELANQPPSPATGG